MDLNWSSPRLLVFVVGANFCSADCSIAGDSDAVDSAPFASTLALASICIQEEEKRRERFILRTSISCWVCLVVQTTASGRLQATVTNAYEHNLCDRLALCSTRSMNASCQRSNRPIPFWISKIFMRPQCARQVARQASSTAPTAICTFHLEFDREKTCLCSSFMFLLEMHAVQAKSMEGHNLMKIWYNFKKKS